jgi:energy-coupling factor transporter ATP-binding protein EcfA2
MKITKVQIPASKDGDGLEEIKMDKLGSIVLLAGKNGSGKTRILNKVMGHFHSKPGTPLTQQSERQVRDFESLLSQQQVELEQYKHNLSIAANSQVEDAMQQNIRNITQSINNTIQQKKNPEHILSWNLIETSTGAEKYSSVFFVPKNVELHDSYNFSKADLVAQAKAVGSLGTGNLAGGTLAKIQLVQERWFNATHQNSGIKSEEKQELIEDYNRLQDAISLFLNERLGRNADGDATLFGFPIGKARLSDGQKVLLQFCVAIYSQQAALKDVVVVLDEPENHLHPSVIIETIERIKQSVPDGQIWIATHSIPLLAHFDPSLIWYVEKNKIQHAGKIPEKVLCSLLGSEEEIARLQDFISLPAQYATSNYAFESLLEPAVVTTGTNDPQTRQIRKTLLELSSTGVIRILDFGAGKGRLISNIVDVDEATKEQLVKQLDYIAFDPNDTDKAVCDEAITKAYGSPEGRYFNSMTELLSKYDKESFHVVVMCNVLHEIDPKEWLKLFKEEGTVTSLLSKHGILLLVEDHQMPIGEKAYQKGFLVLDTPQLKELFNISEIDRGFVYDSERQGRLKAHRIPKECLARITAPTRIKAINSVSKTARHNILEIRSAPQNYSNGKLHGFWTQQFANAELNLDELGEE